MMHTSRSDATPTIHAASDLRGTGSVYKCGDTARRPVTASASLLPPPRRIPGYGDRGNDTCIYRHSGNICDLRRRRLGRDSLRDGYFCANKLRYNDFRLTTNVVHIHAGLTGWAKMSEQKSPAAELHRRGEPGERCTELWHGAEPFLAGLRNTPADQRCGGDEPRLIAHHEGGQQPIVNEAE